MDLKDNIEEFRKLHELRILNYKSINDLNIKLNYYITFSSALLLVYIFNNLNILKSLGICKFFQFLIVLIPLINISLSLLKMHLFLKDSILIGNLITFNEEIIEIKKETENFEKISEKIFKKDKSLKTKCNRVSKCLKFITFFINISVTFTIIEIGYIFYLLIYKQHYSILINF